MLEFFHIQLKLDSTRTLLSSIQTQNKQVEFEHG